MHDKNRDIQRMCEVLRSGPLKPPPWPGDVTVPKNEKVNRMLLHKMFDLLLGFSLCHFRDDIQAARPGICRSLLYLRPQCCVLFFRMFQTVTFCLLFGRQRFDHTQQHYFGLAARGQR